MLGRFSYSAGLADQFPELASLVVFASGVSGAVAIEAAVAPHLDRARARLAELGSESQYPSVQAWRAAYRATGVDPTKARMAAESILRRLRTTGDFPRLHPLVMLCNALSARFAMPVAALDRERIDGDLRVEAACGGEIYDGFDGSQSPLPAGEVTFKDGLGRAHARKWSHRQSGLSAVGAATRDVIIVAEAVHGGGAAELEDLRRLLEADLRENWRGAVVSGAVLTGAALVAGLAA